MSKPLNQPLPPSHSVNSISGLVGKLQEEVKLIFKLNLMFDG